jgi:hypothetical protein
VYVGGSKREGSAVVRLRFRDREFDVPVSDGYFAWASFAASADDVLEVVV